MFQDLSHCIALLGSHTILILWFFFSLLLQEKKRKKKNSVKTLRQPRQLHSACRCMQVSRRQQTRRERWRLKLLYLETGSPPLNSHGLF